MLRWQHYSLCRNRCWLGRGDLSQVSLTSDLFGKSKVLVFIVVFVPSPIFYLRKHKRFFISHVPVIPKSQSIFHSEIFFTTFLGVSLYCACTQTTTTTIHVLVHLQRVGLFFFLPSFPSLPLSFKPRPSQIEFCGSSPLPPFFPLPCLLLLPVMEKCLC